MIRIHSLLVILHFFAAGSSCAGEFEFLKPIRIESGLIEGVVNAPDGVVAFKGIPFAAAPVGNLRWQSPQPTVPWEGVRKADRFGASCSQRINEATPPYTKEFRVPNELSEDCLFLNVWTPAKTSADKVPVFVFVHGGSYTNGSGSVSLYDGTELAKKGILVVTVNYRLGVLGFFAHPELTAESNQRSSGNYALLDLIAALKWVQKNIGSFGGDPNKVTLAGQSAGSGAVHSLTVSPLAKGLFHRVIAQSFSYTYLMQPAKMANLAKKEKDGLKFAEAKRASSLADLRKMPVAELIADDPALDKMGVRTSFQAPIADGWILPEKYVDAVEKRIHNDVPTLTGLTADDFGRVATHSNTTMASFATIAQNEFLEKKTAFLALYPATSDHEARAMNKLMQQERGMAATFFWAKWRAKTSSTPVYTYYFEQAIPWPEHPEFGAFHSSDLFYQFNNLKKLDRPWTKDDWRVADEVSSYWVNFVKTGDPNGANLPTWKPFDAADPSTMTLGIKPNARPIAEKERFRFYQELFEK